MPVPAASLAPAGIGGSRMETLLQIAEDHTALAEMKRARGKPLRESRGPCLHERPPFAGFKRVAGMPAHIRSSSSRERRKAAMPGAVMAT